LILGIDAITNSSGGGATYLSEFINSYLQANTNIDKVYVWGSKDVLDKIANHSRVIKVSNWILNKGTVFKLIWSFLFFKNDLSKYGCNILIVYSGITNIKNIPVITICQNLLPYDKKNLRKYFLSINWVRLKLIKYIQIKSFNMSSATIFLSDYAYNVVSKYLNKNIKHSVIPLGVSRKFFNNHDVKLINDVTNILYVSSFDKYKNQEKLLEAVIDLVENKLYKIQLTLIGDPMDQNTYNNIKNLSNNRNYIHYKSGITYNEIQKYYHDCDIYVYLSTCENMPNTLTEAMASNLPILCSNKSVMPEIIKDGALLCDPENIVEVTEKLSQLIMDEGLRKQISSLAYKYACELEWSQNFNKTYQLINEVYLNEFI
jgi:glycosyltransferase involved in cell wall biosynthesis